MKDKSKNIFYNFLAGILVKSDYRLKNSILKALNRILFRTTIKNDKEIKRILIFRTGSIGDNICAFPAVYSLKKHFSHAALDILYTSGGENLISIGQLLDNSLVNKFISYKGMSIKMLINELRRQNYDIFVELSQTHSTFWQQIRNMFFVRIIGVRYAFGWEIAATKWFSQWQEKNIRFENTRGRFLRQLSEKGIKKNDIRYPFQITTSDQNIVDNLIEKNQLQNRAKNVGIVAGAKRPQNRWHVEYFKQVITFLSKNNFKCLLIGGKNDKKIAEKLADVENVYDFTGKVSPVQSYLLFTHCRFVVSNDTGPMHLAYAAGAYVFAIFSSRDYPNLWYPPEKQSIVFRNNNIHCSVCFSETCKDNQCMQQILPETVITAIKNVIPITEKTENG